MPATANAWRRPTSARERPAGHRRRGGPGSGLRARGSGPGARLRGAAADQLRPWRADHSRRLHPRADGGLAARHERRHHRGRLRSRGIRHGASGLPADARRGRRLRRRAPPRRASGRRDRLRVPDRRAAGGRRGDPADGAAPARDPHLRPAGRDPGAGWRGGGRDRPARHRHARRLRDRLRRFCAGRPAAGGGARIPAVIRLPARHRHAAVTTLRAVRTRAPDCGGAGVSALPRQGLDGAVAFAAPVTLVLLVALFGNTTEAGTREDVIAALVAVSIVVALHVFIGNSGVISFGHISFVALGAFAAGLMTIPAEIKPTLLPELFPFLADNDIGNVPSLALAAALGGLFAFLAGLPLMRLSGIAAGIATFAVLEITHNV